MSGDNAYFKFDLPTSWRHGKGLAGRTGEFAKQLGCWRALLPTDSLSVRLKVVKPVLASLEAENISATKCDEVDRDPTVALFESLTRKLDLKGMDAIIAVGGGSVIDVAKGLTLIGTYGGISAVMRDSTKYPAFQASRPLPSPPLPARAVKFQTV